MTLRNILVAVIFILTIAVSCTKDAGSPDSAFNSTGQGGSLARFTIAANHLYMADNSTLNVYSLADPANPNKIRSVSVGRDVETIYPYQDKLFIGSMEGMFIYSIADPSNPKLLGTAKHVRTCDPVVANDSIAYVTLRGSGNCGAPNDALYIYDIRNLLSPVQTAMLPLSTPYGLGLKDSVVFVCRGTMGLSFINVKKPASPAIMYTIGNGQKSYKDVIPYENLLICYLDSGIQIIDISDLENAVVVGEL